MIQPLVGPEKKSFLVHKNTICDAVEAFAKMFRGAFKEAETNRTEFPEDDPDAFGLLIQWCYRGDCLPEFGDSTGPEECRKRIRLYCLAEKYCLPRSLMDESMDFMRRGLRTNWD